MGEQTDRPTRITEPRLVLTEGRDAFFVCVWAVQAYGLGHVQVIDFGGNAELPQKLAVLKSATGYDLVETLAIIRDAETDGDRALQSVQGALLSAELPVPESVCQVEPGTPSTAIFLFPGCAEEPHRPVPGTLEDLCMRTVGDSQILSCVDSFLECVSAGGPPAARPHKARLHAYLAGHDEFIGMKIGEAARAGAWDWQHPAMGHFREFLGRL